MKTLQIVDLIKELPLAEKLFIIELVFKDLREVALKKDEEEQKRKEAAQLLLEDYQSDEELITFTALH